MRTAIAILVIWFGSGVVIAAIWAGIRGCEKTLFPEHDFWEPRR